MQASPKALIKSTPIKSLAIALPLLVAASLTQPAQASGFTAQFGNGNFTITLSDGKPYKHIKRNKRHDKLTPRQVVRKLKKRGFYDFRKVRDKGSVYVVKAHGRRGNLVRVVVHARSGEILERRVLRYAHRHQRYDRYAGGWYARPAWAY